MSDTAREKSSRHIAGRVLWNMIALGACYGAAAIVVLPLGLIVWHLLVKGLPALNLSFFIHMPKPVGEAGGGMANAIVGTLILVGLGALVAVPVGVGAGVYLAEFGRGRFAALVRYTADLLSGVPSIVVGVAAYGLVVLPMGGFSALAGGMVRVQLTVAPFQFLDARSLAPEPPGHEGGPRRTGPAATASKAGSGGR